MAYIHKIITGHYLELLPEELEKLLRVSADWFAVRQEELYRIGNEKHQSLLNHLIRTNTTYHDFEEIVDLEKVGEFTMFVEDAFTEPFPSTHDMPEIHLSQKITEILALHGVSESESKKYGIHIKDHLVNHDMVCGVIRFDIVQLN